jgi:SAM-dependent methyltransferase
LPLLDRSVDVVASVHGRRNPEECARVLTRAGVLVIAVPAADDLAELRAEVQGEAVARDRRTALLEEHAPWFAAVEQFESREVHDLEGEALRDLLRGTYRGERRSAHASIAALEHLRVTIASDVFVMRRRD